MATTRSARGELVDFDLLKIKQQIASAPAPVAVAARQDFIDQKFKRKLRKLSQEVKPPQPSPPPVVEPEDVKAENEEVQKTVEENNEAQNPVAPPPKTKK